MTELEHDRIRHQAAFFDSIGEDIHNVAVDGIGEAGYYRFVMSNGQRVQFASGDTLKEYVPWREGEWDSFVVAVTKDFEAGLVWRD